MTDARVWYFHTGEQQFGPITKSELIEYIANKTANLHHYIFCEGFEDWKLLSDLPELVSIAQNTKQDKRNKVPRAPIYELVVAHNGAHVATGTLRNISATGVFFETKDIDFDVDEEIKLTLKEGRGLGKPLHLRCVVVRKAADKRFPQGYGLELKDLDPQSSQRISDYIKKHQQAS